MRKFSNQSIRILLIQIIAVMFLAIGINQLFLIRDVDVIELANHYGASEVPKHLQEKYGPAITEKIISMMMRDDYANSLAMVVGCLFSAIIVWHSTVTRLLPVGLYFFSVLIIKIGVYKSHFILTIINSSHVPIASFGLLPALWATGILFIGGAVVLFFNKQLNGFAATSALAVPPLQTLAPRRP
ncbi:hypothetical protein [Hymenobacter coccineus]|uniref:hypothetical protein n=1 Tax=Hymenobacter coccineus TaxID=1908235 RepID=UPI000F774734|nr:hypothetical protein [Hymenobacter coccineus]